MRALLCTVPLNIGWPRSDSPWPVVPKIAIVSLIKWMERHGYKSEMYDFYDIDMLDPRDDEIQEYIEAYQPTVVGLSAVVSTSYLQVKRLANILRNTCPDTWIIMGGNLAAAANVVLRKTDVDICVHGDGEIPWVEFLDYVQIHGRQWSFRELSQIKGLTYIDENGELQFNGYADRIPSSANPFPDYDILALGLINRPEMLQNYFREGLGSDWFRQDPRSHEKNRRPKFAALWVTKGCVARCTFCQRSTKGYRLFDLKALDEHLTLLAEKYDVGFIQIVDENFGASKPHAYEVARLMKRHHMLWLAGGIRCTSVNSEDVKFYRDHGCAGLKFGVESGSQEMLDLMEKKFTVEQVCEAVGYCIENDVYSPIAVMTGMPGETDETARQTGELIGNIACLRDVPPSESWVEIFYALPLPGTPLYEYGQQIGVIGTFVVDEEEYLISVSDCSSKKMKMNYINLNGVGMRRVLFWDILIRLEATRTFYRKRLENSNHQIKNLKPRIVTRYPSERESRLQYLFRVFKKYVIKDKGRGLLLIIMSKVNMKLSEAKMKFVSNPFIARLPSPLVDSLTRNVIYISFLVERTIARMLFKINKRRGRETVLRNLYKNYELLKQISDEELSALGGGPKGSLRNIVRIRRERLPSPATLTDKNRQILSMGR